MPRQLISPAAISAQERNSRSQLHQLLHQAEGFLHGSLIEVARRCGKPTCRCASDDKARHRSLYLGQTLQGKTTMQYIPADMEPTVRQWAADFQLAAKLLEEISQQGRVRLTQGKQRAAVIRKAATKTTSARKAPKHQPPQPPF